MFILDTNVVSELRKLGLGRADAKVAAWADRAETGTLYLSAITVLELEYGVLRLERRDAAQATPLRRWLNQAVLPSFDGRILPVDTAVARFCAQLHLPDRRSDRDAFVAATALVHRMTIVTRNVADFEPTGVPLLNPWDR
ncbi:MAG TPA: type II toxin-antitoxin system VapC family toxin [Caulobacteraceae bacterium]|nr:type II toxin-antitoxin system VapC family toxin [Caulobacteraceae bacterium]